MPVEIIKGVTIYSEKPLDTTQRALLEQDIELAKRQRLAAEAARRKIMADQVREHFRKQNG